jgi:hypothetical protein
MFGKPIWPKQTRRNIVERVDSSESELSTNGIDI